MSDPIGTEGRPVYSLVNLEESEQSKYFARISADGFWIDIHLHDRYIGSLPIAIVQAMKDKLVEISGADGWWKCACGNIHSPCIKSCMCGFNR